MPNVANKITMAPQICLSLYDQNGSESKTQLNVFTPTHNLNLVWMKAYQTSEKRKYCLTISKVYIFSAVRLQKLRAFKKQIRLQ